MPGGRGTLLDIAVSLNNDNHSEIAAAVKSAIDTGYRISNTSVSLIGASYVLCENTDDLTDVWCHANEQGAVDWGEY